MYQRSYQSSINHQKLKCHSSTFNLFEMQCDRFRNLHLVLYIPNTHSSPDWANLKPQARTCILTWKEFNHHPPLSRCISRNWNHKQSSQDSKQPSNIRCGCPSCDLTHCATTPALILLLQLQSTSAQLNSQKESCKVRQLPVSNT